MDVLRLTLRQLQIFVAVAQTGSTTAASDALALSQTATSAAVKELERLLSLHLFDRVGRRLLLNDSGRALLPQAQELLHNAHQVERMAHGAGQQLQSLRIGASSTIGNQVLPPLLAAYLGRSPQAARDWHSSVAIGNTGDICAQVARFDLDIGLIEGACHVPLLTATPWLQDELLLVAAPHSAPLAPGGQPLDRAQLRSAVWLLREPGSGTREAADQALLPQLKNYRRTIELGSSEAIQHAAAAGLGVACLSRWVVQDFVQSGRLVVLRTVLPPLRRQCYWVVHRDKHFTPALQRFVDLLGAGASAGAATDADAKPGSSAATPSPGRS